MDDYGLTSPHGQEDAFLFGEGEDQNENALPEDELNIGDDQDPNGPDDGDDDETTNHERVPPSTNEEAAP